jgi:fatty acid-binding protein DegV
MAGHAITIKMKNEEEMQTQQWSVASFAAQFQDLPKTDG